MIDTRHLVFCLFFVLPCFYEKYIKFIFTENSEGGFVASLWAFISCGLHGRHLLTPPLVPPPVPVNLWSRAPGTGLLFRGRTWHSQHKTLIRGVLHGCHLDDLIECSGFPCLVTEELVLTFSRLPSPTSHEFSVLTQVTQVLTTDFIVASSRGRQGLAALGRVGGARGGSLRVVSGAGKAAGRHPEDV